MILSARCGSVFTAMVMLSTYLHAADAGAPKEIDLQKSSMTVKVSKSGLLSGFAHDHEISAPIARGSIDESGRSVDLSVDARQMRVVDKDVSEKDRAEIQGTMLGPRVLDSGQFPEIRFHTTSVEPAGVGRWTVTGELTLHGQTRALRFEAHGQNGHYQGAAQLRQKDFGIEPISIGGGTVKVKDEIRVEFDIVAKP